MARGFALLVGLKSVDPAAYGGWDGTSGAKGCENDVDNMKDVISSAAAYDFKILRTGEATASEILSGIKFAADNLNSGDMFVFYFSGHGGQKPDINGDETGEYDQTLIAYDKEIIDDELASLWSQFKSGVRIVMLSDSCNSGTNQNLMAMSNIQGATPARTILTARKPINFSGKVPEMQAQLIHYGACRDGEASIGYMLGGAFTLALCEAWDKGNFSGTYRQLYDAIKTSLKRHGEPQEPQFNFYGKVQPEFLNSRPFTLV